MLKEAQSRTNETAWGSCVCDAGNADGRWRRISLDVSSPHLIIFWTKRLNRSFFCVLSFSCEYLHTAVLALTFFESIRYFR